MSRASTERDEAVKTMMTAVRNGAFSGYEVEQMFMAALNGMNVTEMESLVRSHTRYDDLMDVEVAVM